MSDFDIDLTAPLDDNILKDFSPSYQTQTMGHMNQASQMIQNQQLNRGQQMRPQVQINQIRQQIQNSSVVQQSSNSPSPVVSSPSPNPVNSPQPQLQKLNTQQNVRIAPQQINYQQVQQQPVTLVSNAQKNYISQPQQQSQSMAYQQQYQPKVQPQQINTSTSATRINSQYQTSTTAGVNQSTSQTNNMSQQNQPTILVKNANGHYQVLAASNVQANKPNVQQTNSSMNIQQQQQQQQQQQLNSRSQMSQQSNQNQPIVRFQQGNIQQQGQQQVISAQQLNQQGQNLVVITTSNGGLTTLSNSNSSNLIASIKTQPQQNNQQQNQNYVYQNKTGLGQSQGAGYANVQSERSSLTPTPNSMMMQQQQQQQRSVQQTQQTGTAASQANPPSGLDLLKCLRKFLHTLLDLAKNSLPEKFQVVQSLIQELLDERIDPETFIRKIQIEKNPPSPSLVPFLTRAINQWKQMRGNQSISISKFFEMIPQPNQQQSSSTQSSTQASNQQPSQQQQQNTPIVITAPGSNTSSQTTTNSSGIPVITSISQSSLSHGQNVLILNRSSSNVGQQQVQSGIQQPLQQHRTAPQQQQQQIQQNGVQLTQQQLQIQQHKYQQQQQQKMQQVQIQNQVQTKTSSPQIQFISTNQNGSFNIQSQFNQSAGKVTIQQQQQQQLQQSPHGTNIALAKVASSQYQAQSPQQIQQNAQPPVSSVKILNTNITNLKQITSPINQSSVISSMAGISSPIKIEQQHLGQHTPQSPAKLVQKVIKMEELQPKIKTESDDESTSMFGVDLEAEKKTLLGSSTLGRGNNLEQIRVFKEEKFLNIMILHKKFVEIAKKHKLDDVSVDVATLVSHATQEYLRGILEKLNVVSQHRLDLSMRTNDAYEMTNDVKSQIKFMEELDKIEKKRKDEADRERLMKAAKSRSKGEDGGELSKLKQKAKEVIQAESDELRRQDANKTALAAIGPRKKRKIDFADLPFCTKR